MSRPPDKLNASDENPDKTGVRTVLEVHPLAGRMNLDPRMVRRMHDADALHRAHMERRTDATDRPGGSQATGADRPPQNPAQARTIPRPLPPQHSPDAVRRPLVQPSTGAVRGTAQPNGTGAPPQNPAQARTIPRPQPPQQDPPLVRRPQVQPGTMGAQGSAQSTGTGAPTQNPAQARTIPRPAPPQHSPGLVRRPLAQASAKAAQGPAQPTGTGAPVQKPVAADAGLQAVLQKRQALVDDTVKNVKAMSDRLTSPLAKAADRRQLLTDCETDIDSDFGRVVDQFDVSGRDGYDQVIARYIEAKRLATKYIKDHADPKIGKLPARVLKRRQACQDIIAKVDKQLSNVGEQNLAALTLARDLRAKLAQGVEVPFKTSVELRKLLPTRLLSDETKAELQAAIDAIDDAERRAGYAALAKLPADADDRDRAEVLNRHGCFKGTDGGTSDVRLLQNPDKTIAFAFKSVTGESQGGLDFLGLGKGASSMREDVASAICAEIAAATRGKLDLGFPTSRLVKLDGAAGALIEGVPGEMADPEEKNGLFDYEKLHGAEAAQKKREEIEKACREIPDKVSADSLQNVVLSSAMTCQWDCKWGNMIVQGDRARPIDGGTAIPTKDVIRSFMEAKGGPPSMDAYIRYPRDHPKAGEIMPTAKTSMSSDKVDAILALDPARIAAQAKARRDQLLRDFPDLDPGLMEDSCIDIVEASMQAAKDIVKKDRTITLEGFVQAYEAWFVDYYQRNVKT